MSPNDKDDEYGVGYAKPPLDTRYKKGKSGNPRGRPKGSGNLSTALARELVRTVSITEGGRRRKISAINVIAKQIVAKAASGRLDAAKMINALVPLQPEECTLCATVKHASREENE